MPAYTIAITLTAEGPNASAALAGALARPLPADAVLSVYEPDRPMAVVPEALVTATPRGAVRVIHRTVGGASLANRRIGYADELEVGHRYLVRDTGTVFTFLGRFTYQGEPQIWVRWDGSTERSSRPAALVEVLEVVRA